MSHSPHTGELRKPGDPMLTLARGLIGCSTRKPPAQYRKGYRSTHRWTPPVWATPGTGMITAHHAQNTVSWGIDIHQAGGLYQRHYPILESRRSRSANFIRPRNEDGISGTDSLSQGVERSIRRRDVVKRNRQYITGFHGARLRKSGLTRGTCGKACSVADIRCHPSLR